MERSRSLVLLLLSIAILFPAFAQETGPKITLRTDAFQVSFPGKPSHQQHVSDSGHVHVEQHAYSYENAVSKFILSYAQLTPAPVNLNAGRALDSAISGTVENVTGKLQAAKPAVIQGKPAKSVTITVGENTVIDGQFIYVEPRVYQLLVLHGNDAKPDFERQFFDSFVLR